MKEKDTPMKKGGEEGACEGVEGLGEAVCKEVPRLVKQPH